MVGASVRVGAHPLHDRLGTAPGDYSVHHPVAAAAGALLRPEASVLEPHLQQSGYPNHGQRVVTGQRLLQTVPDTFLGWSSGPDGNDYYVRQLWDMKGGIDAYLGKSDAFDEAIAAFAVTYADVNDRDHQTLAAAVEAGKLQAVNDL